MAEQGQARRMSDRETDAQIESLLEQGTRRHMEGDLAAAAAIYEQVLAARPYHADALNLLGVVALQGGAPDQAADLLRQAVALDDKHPGYLNNLGQALDVLGDVAEALRYYRAALALAPGDPRCLNNIGLALSQLGDLEGAIEAVTAAVAGDPDNPEFHHNHGAILYDMGRVDDAEPAFRRALELNPEQAGTYASMGLILAERGDRQQAIEHCLQSTALDPFYDEGHEACRKLLWDLGDTGNMNISYQLACERHPDSTEIFTNYGAALLESHLPGQAVEVLDRALALDCRNARALSKKGAALARLGRWKEAIAVQLEAIALDDRDFAFHEALGDAYAAERDFEQAARAYRAAHERNPRRSSVLASLTVALNELGDPAVDRLVDYDTFVTSRFIDIPEGFASLEEFNDARAAALSDRADHARRHAEQGPPVPGGGGVGRGCPAADQQCPVGLYRRARRRSRPSLPALHQPRFPLYGRLVDDPAGERLRREPHPQRRLDQRRLLRQGAGDRRGELGRGGRLYPVRPPAARLRVAAQPRAPPHPSRSGNGGLLPVLLLARGRALPSEGPAAFHRLRCALAISTDVARME
jgi:Flp pilus assembly protein TadD